MTDREGSKDSQPFHLILLAKDWTGYQNLCRLVTDAHLDGYYYKPRIDREHLARHSEGLIGLSACLNGEVARALETDDWESARRLAGEYSDIFGPATSSWSSRTTACPSSGGSTSKLLRLAPEVGLPLVATNDLHYVHRAQHEAHDALLCVGTGVQHVRHANRLRFETRGVLPQVRRPDGGALPGPAGGDRQHPAHRRDGRTCSFDVRAAAPARTSRCRTATRSRAGCARSASAASRERYGTVTDELQRRLDYELGRDHPDGLRGLLPDRGGLRPVRPRAAHRDHLPRLARPARS